MKASDLNKLLIGHWTGDDLKQSIMKELQSYGELIGKRGSRITLVFDEDEEVNFDNSALQKLLQETLAGRLSNVDLAYICDCLTMSEKVDFADEKTQDIVFEIADPEINGGFKSDSEIQGLIAFCRVSS